MKRQAFRQVLDEVAAKAVPDSTNIREAVMSQLTQDNKPKRKRQPRTLRRWMLRIAAVLVLVIGFGLVLRMNQQDDFIPQQSSSGDNGIFKAASARLVKQLNLEAQPVKEDVIVTLKWAYADGNRIALEYSVNFADRLTLPGIDEITLVDRDSGQSFAMLEHDSAGTGQSNSRRYFGRTISFDASTIQGDPAKLNLRLNLDFSGTEVHQGKGVGRSVEPFDVNFEFDVPFIPAVALPDTYTAAVTPGIAVTSDMAENVSMTLSRIVYAPSMTRAELCYTVPDGEMWEPGLTNALEDSPVIEAYFKFDEGETAADGQLCGTLDVMATWYTRSDKYTIEIESLVNNTVYASDRLKSFEMALHQQGIEARATMPSQKNTGANLTFWYGPVQILVKKLPSGMSITTIEQIIDETGAAMFGTAMMGPWRFELDVPPVGTR